VSHLYKSRGVIVGSPMVFDFGWVGGAADIAQAVVEADRISRLGGSGLRMFTHGRHSAFEIMQFTIGYEQQLLQPLPLSLFRKFYPDMVSLAFGVTIPVRIQVRNIEPRSYPLIIALERLVIE